MQAKMEKAIQHQAPLISLVWQVKLSVKRLPQLNPIMA